MRFCSRLSHARRTALRPRPYFAVPVYAQASAQPAAPANDAAATNAVSRAALGESCLNIADFARGTRARFDGALVVHPRAD